MSEEVVTPVTIIGGYLGSGKTTLVNHLLRNANGKRLAILVNEFGELPIDADLIEAEDDDIISLTGGCVCCSYGNDLIMAMIEMAKMSPRPDHIVLEASGVALPGSIANSLSLLSDYRVDGIVVLADAESVQTRANDKYMGDTINRQLDDADIIILNKTDLVPEDAQKEIFHWLESKSKHASIIAAKNSAVPLQVVLDDFQWQPNGKSAKGVHQTGLFSTEFLEFSAPIDAEKWTRELIEQNPNILRAKGFVHNLNDEYVGIQVVGKRWEICPAPKNATSGVVVIKSNEPSQIV